MTEQGWGRASVKAAVVLAAAVVGLLVVPDRLVAVLAQRVSPGVRDLLVTGWVVVALVALSRFLLALQGGRRPE